jgi:hypothetical protein
VVTEAGKACLPVWSGKKYQSVTFSVAAVIVNVC